MAKGLQLETKRLVLKVLDPSFAEKVLDFFVRNKSFLQQWEPFRDESFYTVDFQKQQLADDLKKMEEGRLFKVWIFEKGDRCFAEVLGSIALNEVVRGCFHSCFLGYRMDQHHANKGYMTEGVAAVIAYAFNVLKLHRIEANIMPSNKASLQVVKKLGFYEEGLAKKYLWRNKLNNIF